MVCPGLLVSWLNDRLTGCPKSLSRRPTMEGLFLYQQTLIYQAPLLLLSSSTPLPIILFLPMINKELLCHCHTYSLLLSFHLFSSPFTYLSIHSPDPTFFVLSSSLLSLFDMHPQCILLSQSTILPPSLPPSLPLSVVCVSQLGERRASGLQLGPGTGHIIGGDREGGRTGEEEEVGENGDGET